MVSSISTISKMTSISKVGIAISQTISVVGIGISISGSLANGVGISKSDEATAVSMESVSISGSLSGKMSSTGMSDSRLISRDKSSRSSGHKTSSYSGWQGISTK